MPAGGRRDGHPDAATHQTLRQFAKVWTVNAATLGGRFSEGATCRGSVDVQVAQGLISRIWAPQLWS